MNQVLQAPVCDQVAGQKFGEWTVLGIHPSLSKTGKPSIVRWAVRCSCGHETDHHKFDLQAGKTTRCRQCFKDGATKLESSVCAKCGAEKIRIGTKQSWGCMSCLTAGAKARNAANRSKGLTNTGKRRDRMPRGSMGSGSIKVKEAGKMIGPKELCRGCGKLLRYFWDGYKYRARCVSCITSNETHEQKLMKAKKQRRCMLKVRYGMALEDYDRLEEKQGHKCAICGCDEPGGVGKVGADGIKKWHVDHCHDTGKVRGLLCGHCNKGLGHFMDKTYNLEKAVLYLRDAELGTTA